MQTEQSSTTASPPQTDIAVSWKNGVYADLWTSTAFNKHRDFDKEIDVTLGKTGKLGKFDYVVDAAYFLIVIKDVIDINGELSREFKIGPRLNLAPFIRGERYFPTQKGGPRAGKMSIGGMRGQVQLASRVKLAFRGWLKKDTGCFGFDPATLGQGYVGLSFNVTDKWTLLPGVTFSKPFTNVSVHDGRKSEANWEFTTSYRFR